MGGELIVVNDLMQSGYVYVIEEPSGKNFHSDFRPELTPKKMLELGVFGGKYMTDCKDEFPREWFVNARLSSDRADPELNLFRVSASQPLYYPLRPVSPRQTFAVESALSFFLLVRDHEIALGYDAE